MSEKENLSYEERVKKYEEQLRESGVDSRSRKDIAKSMVDFETNPEKAMEEVMTGQEKYRNRLFEKVQEHDEAMLVEELLKKQKQKQQEPDTIDGI